MKKLFFALLIGLMAGAGCGSGTSEVTGKVSFPDGSPLTNGVVTFTAGANSFRGNLGSDGTYKISEIESGDYLVSIQGAYEPTESTSSTGMEYDAQGNYIEAPAGKTAPPKPLIREALMDPESSGLKTTVPGGNYDFVVELP